MNQEKSKSAFLPAHGKINCTRCHHDAVVFDHTQRADGDWRITANPLAWGNVNPEVLVLGFSKGPNALGALVTKHHDLIPYAGQRTWVKKILSCVGVIKPDENIDQLIANQNGRFAWGSLIRCSVERKDGNEWKGSGGGMLNKFVATPFGRDVATNCVKEYLFNLPSNTKLVILFGLGTKNGYVTEARKLIQNVRHGSWRTVNEVAYTDGKVMFVHVEHFASQGRLIPDWCGEPNPKKDNAISPRSKFSNLARDAINETLAQGRAA